MDNMASTCPLKFLPCVPGPQEGCDFTEGGTDEPYFLPGDRLDYFSFFLRRGSHHRTNAFVHDPEDTSCDWKIDHVKKPWPMTPIDCTLGLDNVERAGETALKNAILNFHKPHYKPEQILMCALNILGGQGDAEGGICDFITPSECQSKDGHKFGGFFEDVFGTKELAHRQPCEQSTVAYGGVCERANDGNTNGVYGRRSVTHTRNLGNQWWKVNLKEQAKVTDIVIWKRSDECCPHRGVGAVVRLLDSYGKTVWTSPPFVKSRLQFIRVPKIKAAAVQVFLEEAEYLELAEVLVYGDP